MLSHRAYWVRGHVGLPDMLGRKACRSSREIGGGAQPYTVASAGTEVSTEAGWQALSLGEGRIAARESKKVEGGLPWRL